MNPHRLQGSPLNGRDPAEVQRGYQNAGSRAFPGQLEGNGPYLVALRSPGQGTPVVGPALGQD